MAVANNALFAYFQILKYGYTSAYLDLRAS